MDLTTTNNSLNNLQLMLHCEHNSLHSKLVNKERERNELGQYT